MPPCRADSVRALLCPAALLLRFGLPCLRAEQSREARQRSQKKRSARLASSCIALPLRRTELRPDATILRDSCPALPSAGQGRASDSVLRCRFWLLALPKQKKRAARPEALCHAFAQKREARQRGIWVGGAKEARTESMTTKTTIKLENPKITKTYASSSVTFNLKTRCRCLCAEHRIVARQRSALLRNTEQTEQNRQNRNVHVSVHPI